MYIVHARSGMSEKGEDGKILLYFYEEWDINFAEKGSGGEEEEAKDRGINFLYLRGRRKGGGDTSSKSRRCRRRV